MPFKNKIKVFFIFFIFFRSPHVNGIFSPLGHLLKVDAKSPKDGSTATLEFHSLKSIMSRQPGCKELKAFPGPLVPGKTDKMDVIRFCQNKIEYLNKSGNNRTADKESQILMWDLMILLLRQKNRPDGSDIAELLCPFDEKNQQSFYKSVGNHSAGGATAVTESGNENPTDMSDIEQETDEDYVKVSF